MANTLEKHFLVINNIQNIEVLKQFVHFMEHELVSDDNKDRNKHMHWMRIWGGRFYLIGTFENTIWTPNKIISRIRKGVPDAHSVFCVEVQDRDCQGMMDADFWDFLHNIQDLTKYMSSKRRAAKLRHIKSLIEKKEELKRKSSELRNREAELLRKKEILSEEEELLRKEEEIRKQEEEVAKKEIEIKKRKKFLGIF